MGVSDNNELIFMDFPYQAIDNRPKFEKYPIVNKEMLRQITLKDNPVLYKY